MMIRHLRQDLRLALRTLTRNALTTLVIVLTLGLAIGATTIVYTVVDFLWRTALPVANRERLVFVSSTDPRPSEARAGMLGSLALTGTSVPDLVDWTAQTSTIEQFAAFTFDSATMTGRDTPLRAAVLRTTTNLSSAWGFDAIAGRTFTAVDARPGAARVAILSEGFWRREFGGRADTVGSRIILNGEPHTVVGVWPAARLVGIFSNVDIITPQSLDATAAARDDRQLFVTARLRAGITRAQAGTELATIAGRLKTAYPLTNARTGVVVRPLIELLGGEVPFILLLLALVALLVIAIACANVCNILLAQGPERQREVAVRAALGASRLDHLRRAMTEAVLLSLAAAWVGVALAAGGIGLLHQLNTGEETVFSQLALNPRVLLACAATALIAPLVFAALPALRSWRPDALDLKDGMRSTGSRSRRRLVKGLVATQVAFATILMVVIGIMGSYAWTWRTAPYGFNPSQLLTFRIDPDAKRLAEPLQIVQFYDELLKRLAAVPGVTDVAAADQISMVARGRTVRIAVDGHAAMRPEEWPSASLAVVTRGFVSTLRVPLLTGRALERADFDSGPPVAMISEEAARQLWPGQNPIGRRFSVSGESLPATSLTVIGVVADARSKRVDQRIVPQFYVPLPWAPARAMTVVARTSLRDPLSLVPTMRREVASIDAMLPIFQIATMTQRLLDDSAGMYTVTALLVAIALVALCMAAGGIYAVVSSSVTQRTREIGVRMAVGATPSAMARMVIRDGALPVGSGSTIGLVAAVFVAQAMAAALTEIDARDPVRYVAVMTVIAGVALTASYIPARRAARVDPVIALRAE
jgi:putative ABC transport system permease protein